MPPVRRQGVQHCADGNGNAGGHRHADDTEGLAEGNAQRNIADDGNAAVYHGAAGILIGIEIAAEDLPHRIHGEHEAIALQRKSAGLHALGTEGAPPEHDLHNILRAHHGQNTYGQEHRHHQDRGLRGQGGGGLLLALGNICCHIGEEYGRESSDKGADQIAQHGGVA